MVVGPLARPYFTSRHEMLSMILGLRKYYETAGYASPPSNRHEYPATPWGAVAK